MKSVVIFMLCVLFFSACDNSRVYEKNHDFENRAWLAKDTPVFEFNIPDTVLSYNLYCNIRNSVAYPFSRIFVTYYLKDSSGMLIQKKLIDQMLFDPKSGEPHGTSGLGDIFDHQAPVVTNYKFRHAGLHKIKFEQFMRMDTLPGIMAVGVRVEQVVK
jgi:gliding motility-associated lipoprotein GldH